MQPEVFSSFFRKYRYTCIWLIKKTYEEKRFIKIIVIINMLRPTYLFGI